MWLHRIWVLNTKKPFYTYSALYLIENCDYFYTRLYVMRFIESVSNTRIVDIYI